MAAKSNRHATGGPSDEVLSSGVPRYRAMVFLQQALQSLRTGILCLTRGFYRILLARPKSASPRRPMSPPPPQVIEETRSILDQFSSLVGLKAPALSGVHLSIVIPAYNEQARLPRTIPVSYTHLTLPTKA